ncbi:hypothetical protein EV586_10841 [Tumebacillus sp. BK434]|uniref:hypothetical protein n=1 Tax=Tumebacillus sp. BK434 TaxID=2512169 RepID=UPI0010484889|nr:hypothetical protein [Tumebacillus sp. BK434]TCP52667.1 hypothetical protein EV586_10841 [Tumebacillus sp. BK434]
MRAKGARPEQGLTKSIVKQMSRIMALLIILILVGGALLYWFNHRMQASFEQQVSELDEKAFLAGEIQQSMSSLMIEYRGYISYHLPDFKGRIAENQRGLSDGVAKFRLVALTESDREHLRFLEDASSRYSKRVTEGVRMIDEGRFDEITKRAGEEGFLTFTDELRARHYMFMEDLRLEQMELRSAYADKVDQHTVYYAEYLLLIAMLIALLAVQFARNVGGPLRTLALFSEHYEDAKIINLPYDKREDEIGYLTRILKQIFMRIKENERKLIEQSQELRLQQDEMMAQTEQLIIQQDEQHHTLVKMKEKESILAAQYELSSSLLNTLDQEELLESIVRNLMRIQQADKGAVVLLESGFPHASVGVGTVGMEQLILSLEESILPRLREERQAFVVEREALTADKGYHEGKMKLYDLFLPILARGGSVTALIILTRIGRRFGPDTIKQGSALSNQIALSINKLRSRELNLQIIDSIREGMLLFNAHGRLVQANRMWAEWMQCQFRGLDESCATELLYRQIAVRVQQSEALIRFLQDAIQGRVSAGEQLVYELEGESGQPITVLFVKTAGGTMFLHRKG